MHVIISCLSTVVKRVKHKQDGGMYNVMVGYDKKILWFQQYSLNTNFPGFRCLVDTQN